MPRTTSGAQDTLFASRASGVATLVDLAFSTGTLYYTTHSVRIAALSRTYLAMPILSVSPVQESQVLTRDKMDISLPIVDTAMLAYTLGPADVYRGREVRVYMQPINSQHVAVGDPLLFFIGTMENFEIQRNSSRESKSSGSIVLRCHRKGMSQFKNEAPARMTHAQQLLDYPGDLGLEYTESLAANPPAWLSKAFQEDGI